MRKKSLQIISFMLAGSMMAALCPTGVLAEPVDEVLSQQTVTTVNVDSADNLLSEIEKATSPTVIQLTAAIDLTEKAPKIAVGQDITLDLNGQTLTTKNVIYVNGTLTIKDSQESGMISGTVNNMITVNSTGNLTLESGVVQTTKNGAVKTNTSNGKDSKFTVNGGKLIGQKALVSSGGIVNIISGRLELIEGSASYAIDNTSATITIGTNGETSKEAPWIDGLDIGTNKSANLYSGFITKVSGTFAPETVFGSSFGSDISNSMPAGKMCV